MLINSRYSLFLRRAWDDVQQQRGRYPWLLAGAFVLLLVFECAPAGAMSWMRWVSLLATVAMVLCCVDFNMMLWRVYHRRKDLQPVRLTLGLVGLFLALLTLGRLLGFAGFFFKALFVLSVLVNLASAAVALALVLMARSVEDLAVGLPALADLTAAHQELHEAAAQLAYRERHALEGMTVMADDTIVEANPAAYRILGYDAAKHELIGLRAHQLLHENDTPRAYASLRLPESVPQLLRVICKDGTVKTIETTGATLTRHDTEVRVSNFRDVTLERRYQELLSQQQREYPEPNAEAMQNLAALQNWFHAEAAPVPFPPLTSYEQ